MTKLLLPAHPGKIAPAATLPPGTLVDGLPSTDLTLRDTALVPMIRPFARGARDSLVINLYNAGD
jgi:hypothetical protein